VIGGQGSGVRGYRVKKWRSQKVKKWRSEKAVGAHAKAQRREENWERAGPWWNVRRPFLASLRLGVRRNWSVVSGQLSVVSGQWSVVSGQLSVVRRAGTGGLVGEKAKQPLGVECRAGAEAGSSFILAGGRGHGSGKPWLEKGDRRLAAPVFHGRYNGRLGASPLFQRAGGHTRLPCGTSRRERLEPPTKPPLQQAESHVPWTDKQITMLTAGNSNSSGCDDS